MLATNVTGAFVLCRTLIPAMISTVARQSEITRTAKRLLPRCEPMMPPIIAAAARMNPSEGMVRVFVK